MTADQVLRAFELLNEISYDKEEHHSEADSLLVKFLRAQGGDFEKVADAYVDAETKAGGWWYA